MPLASADPFGGVIVTDWYAPPTTTGERFKATVPTCARAAAPFADGVKVDIAVFRQTCRCGCRLAGCPGQCGDDGRDREQGAWRGRASFAR